jgi:channel protein (hemolysin III family)
MLLTPTAPMTAIPGFSDPVSSLTHLLASGIFLILGVQLWIRTRATVTGQFGLWIFVVGVVFALSMSGVFHMLTPGTAGRAVLQRLDHAGIFFLIAATFTPVHLTLFRGFLRWGILTLIWGAAISSITLKTIFFNQIAEWFGLSLYLILGWFGLLSGFFLYRRYGYNPLKPLLYGAIAYTFGALLEFARFPVLIPGILGPHELFHLMVLIGISLHWRFIHTILMHTPSATRIA